MDPIRNTQHNVLNLDVPSPSSGKKPKPSRGREALDLRNSPPSGNAQLAGLQSIGGERANQKRSTLQEGTVSARGLRKAAFQTAEAPPLANRPAPILANASDLIAETQSIKQKERIEIAANLIATTYGAGDKPAAEKLASNMMLDLNLHFEEHFQHAVEHHPDSVSAIVDIVQLIHDKLHIGSLEKIDGSGKVSMTEDQRQHRVEYIHAKLQQYFPPAELRAFLAGGNWSDEPFKAFLGTMNEGLNTAEQRDATGLAKLLKMLETQVPYFGGAVEYMEGGSAAQRASGDTDVEDSASAYKELEERTDKSLEYWIYHMSTLTRDPDRQYAISQSEFGQLKKPLKDYRTAPHSEVPFMNQRNLGTGVVEAAWSELPKTLQDLIEHRLAEFNKHVAWHGDNKPPGVAMSLWAAYATAFKRINSPERQGPQASASRSATTPAHLGAAKYKLPTTAELWNDCSEDQKKMIYGDVCGVPWSDAHLHDVHGTFESDYSVSGAASDIVRTKHPRRDEPGLLNVVGVLGNILETPTVAGSKYMVEGGMTMQKLKARDRLKDPNVDNVPTKTLLDDFTEKHQTWYDAAMKNHKPIIGGISGHTLGYMNLYADALEAATPQEREAAPKMEMLRAIMLGGLIGRKRHHSYDEVMVASTAVETPANPRSSYTSRYSYADMFGSSIPAVRQCAEEAMTKTLSEYTTLGRNTVLDSVIGQDVSKDHPLEQAAIDYARTFRSTEQREVDSAGKAIAKEMKRHLPPEELEKKKKSASAILASRIAGAPAPATTRPAAQTDIANAQAEIANIRRDGSDVTERLNAVLRGGRRGG